MTINIIKRATPPSTNSQDNIPEPSDPIPRKKQEKEAWIPAQKGRRRNRKKAPLTPHGIKPYISGMGKVSVTFTSVGNGVEEPLAREKDPQPGLKDLSEPNPESIPVSAKDKPSIPLESKLNPTSVNELDAEKANQPSHIDIHEDEEFTEAEGELEEFLDNDDLLGDDLEAEMEEKNEEEKDVLDEDLSGNLEMAFQGENACFLANFPAPPTASLNKLAINTSSLSNSGSLKRKENGGVEDTASSKMKSNKSNQGP